MSNAARRDAPPGNYVAIRGGTLAAERQRENDQLRMRRVDVRSTKRFTGDGGGPDDDC